MHKLVAVFLFVVVLMTAIVTNKLGIQAGETLKQSVVHASIQEGNHKECIGNFERFEFTIRRLLDAAERRQVFEAQDLVNVTTKGLNLILDTCLYDIMTGPEHDEP